MIRSEQKPKNLDLVHPADRGQNKRRILHQTIIQLIPELVELLLNISALDPAPGSAFPLFGCSICSLPLALFYVVDGEVVVLAVSFMVFSGSFGGFACSFFNHLEFLSCDGW